MRRLEMLSTPAQRALGGAARPVGLDQAMLRRLERAMGRLEPDPLFRRRLRGEIMNRHVAAREGLLAEPRQRRSMGKLGRAVLYASLVLAISVSAAGAAAQESLPGQALYGVKLQLEEIRMRIAPPSARGDLAALALAERVEELESLAEAGAWHMLPAAAARVTRTERELAAAGGDLDALDEQVTQHAVEVLEAVLADAPPSARAGLSQALVAVGALPDAGARPPHAIPGNPRRPAGGPVAEPGTANPARSPKPAPSRAPTQRADPADARSSRSGD
jgi:hypothetical protein